MGKDRLLAFSDGVLAIIITIMVLELKAPHEATFSALGELTSVFLSYVISFIYVGIYWNNHHHMMHTVTHVTGKILWANTHLLFWLSLVPFATAWLGETHFAPLPTALYGIALLMPAIAYFMLQNLLIKTQGRDATLGRAIGNDRKGKISAVLDGISIPMAFVYPPVSWALFAIVALMWLVPDKRIEKTLREQNH